MPALETVVYEKQTNNGYLGLTSKRDFIAISQPKNNATNLFITPVFSVFTFELKSDKYGLPLLD